MFYEVLVHARPAWRVGETKAEREARMRSPVALAEAERYPQDYAGRVISVRRVTDTLRKSKPLPSLKRMASKAWPCVVLDLTAEELAGLTSRTLKVASPASLVPSVAAVSFGDRHGAVAPALRAQFPGDGAAEAAEAKAGDDLDADGWRFVEIASLARDLLPKTETHTGTGLYSVKTSPGIQSDNQLGAPSGQTIGLSVGGLGANAYIGGLITNQTRGQNRAIVSHGVSEATLEGDITAWQNGDSLAIMDSWSTIQAAHDQWYTDQGAAAFTAEQVLRIFDGTYTENVAIQTALAPTHAYRALIEGNAGDTVIVQNTGAASTFTHALGDQFWVYSNLTVRNDQSNKHCIYMYRGYHSRFIDLTIQNTSGTPPSNGIDVGQSAKVRLTRCAFISTGIRMAGGVASRCSFSDAALNGYYNGVLIVEACAFYRGSGAGGMLKCHGAINRIVNCTFVGTGGTEIAIDDYANLTGQWIVRNCIFKDVGTAIRGSATSTSGIIDSDRNCFNGCTTVASWDGSDYATLGAWQAATVTTTPGETGSPDASSISADPLLADPASGDFTPAATSPCDGAGCGAGVAKDVDGTAYDPCHPTMGAVSLGTWPRPGAPVLVSAVDQVDGGSVILTGTAANEADELYAWYQLSGAGAWTKWATPLENGTVTLTGLSVGNLHLFELRPFRFGEWGPASGVKTATPTSATLAALGPVAKPLETFRSSLAESATFRAWVKAVDAGAAKASIHLVAMAPAYGETWPEKRPFALVAPGDPMVEASSEFLDLFDHTGLIDCWLEGEIPTAYRTKGSEEESAVWMLNKAGAILEEIEALAATAGCMNIARVSVSAPERTAGTDEAAGEYLMRVKMRVAWGVA